MEHLLDTYSRAGLAVSDTTGTGRTLGWGYRTGQGATLVYRLLSQVDEHGRILAQRWASMLGGESVMSPATLPTMIRVNRFDVIEGGHR
jgi:hypothetical protein